MELFEIKNIEGSDRALFHLDERDAVLHDFIGCEGIDLNSFVHSQWHKHAKTA